MLSSALISPDNTALSFSRMYFSSVWHQSDFYMTDCGSRRHSLSPLPQPTWWINYSGCPVFCGLIKSIALFQCCLKYRFLNQTIGNVPAACFNNMCSYFFSKVNWNGKLQMYSFFYFILPHSLCYCEHATIFLFQCKYIGFFFKADHLCLFLFVYLV